MAYRTDLKSRVLSFVAAGGSKSEAARRYQVARSTVFVWLKEGPDHLARKPGPKDSR
ncbi:MAG: transposase, partial [Azonexus sp.]|nr:transposase [Azonexus sp.]